MHLEEWKMTIHLIYWLLILQIVAGCGVATLALSDRKVVEHECKAISKFPFQETIPLRIVDL